jgi:SAM-dependent methyltransferase
MIPKEEDQINQLLKSLKRISHISKNEEKLKIETETEFKKYFDSIGFDALTFRDYEKTIAGFSPKRKDAIYGDVIIEYKTPNTLKSETKRQKLISELKDKYLEPLIKKEGEAYRKKVLGVLYDGEYLIFVKWVHHEWQAERTSELDYDSLNYFMRLLIGLRKKTLDAEHLAVDFGLENPLTEEMIAKLFKKLLHSRNKRVKLLYDQWDMSFSYLYSGVFEKPGVIADLRNSYGKKLRVLVDKTVTDKLFFSIYTYYALIIKLLIAELLSNLRGLATYSYIEKLSQSKNLKDELVTLESGEVFRNWYNIHNFLEGSFFSWYLDEWDDEIESEVRRIIEDIRDYEILTFEFKQEEIRDLLKKLYQILVPRAVRHDLGEYYTPDWLAEFTLDESGYTGDPTKRVLDPACGSGTFPVMAIKRINDFYLHNRAEWRGREKAISNLILDNIVGFDINPVAVLASRANYLIAISKFLKYRDYNDLITLPVYLTNSVALPRKSYDIHETEEVYVVTTVAGDFKINKNLVENRKQLEAYFVEIDSYVDLKLEDFEEVFRRDFPDVERKTFNCICNLFERIHKLHLENLNAIWTTILDNRLAPLFVKKSPFDYVVGNPPWVNWEYLSKEYKKDLMSINDEYGLNVTKGLDARSGSVRRDVSSIFLYVSVDIYLKNKGTLSFLIKPQFKNSAGAGFRQFKIKSKTDIKVKSVHDLSSLRVFDEAESETAEITVTKGEKNTYPVPYYLWNSIKKSNIIPTETQSELVKSDFIKIVNLTAHPISSADNLSVWNVTTKEASSKNLLGKFEYKVRAGVYFGLNGVYFLDVLDSEKKEGNPYVYVKNKGAGKKEITQLDARWIESDLVYPLLKDRHVKKWVVKGNYYALIPQKYLGEDNESTLKKQYRKSYEFLKRFETDLNKRKSKLVKVGPFYSIYGLGDWDSPFKVVCASMGTKESGNIKFVVVSTIKDKFLGNKLVIPEHTLSFIPTKDEAEANYVCAIMNSELMRRFIIFFFSSGKSGFGEKLAKEIKLDKFDRNNRLHIKLSELSVKAHELASKGETSKLTKVESEIEEIVKSIYK